MSALAPDFDRTCNDTGFALTATEPRTGWRVTKDSFVRTSGIGVERDGMEPATGCSSQQDGGPPRRWAGMVVNWWSGQDVRYWVVATE